MGSKNEKYFLSKTLKYDSNTKQLKSPDKIGNSNRQNLKKISFNMEKFLAWNLPNRASCRIMFKTKE